MSGLASIRSNVEEFRDGFWALLIEDFDSKAKPCSKVLDIVGLPDDLRRWF